jgi:competence protein ComEA
MNKKALLLALGTVLASGLAIAADAVNINSAQSGEIAKALGVKDYVGARIVAEREDKGPYKSVEDLTKRVSGLDSKAVQKNKDKIKL